MTGSNIHWLIVVAASILAHDLHGAFERLPEGGRAAAMGGVAVAVLKDPWALRANPSLAAMLTDRSLSASFSPSMLGIPEISRSSILYVEPIGSGAAHISATRFGFSLYREMEFSLGWAATPVDQFGCGIAVGLYQVSIERYGSAWTAGLDLGLCYAITPEILFGFSALNATASRIGASRERIPQEFSVGIGYRPTHEIDIGADLVRDPSFPMEVRFGITCEAISGFFIHAGATDRPSSYTAGVGLSASIIRLDYGMSSHPDLGISHHFSMTVFPGQL